MKQTIKPMDEALKTHYQEKSLSESQLGQLMALQTDAESEGFSQDNELLSAEIEQPQSQQTNVLHDAPKAGTANLTFIHKISNKLSSLVPDFGRYQYAFYASACLLLTGLVLSLSLLNQGSLTEQVMDEIAYNHRQEMPVEVAANTMPIIGDYLNRLSFSLISPRALAENGWQLLGGRYCSINGKLAAQLKVRNTQENKVYTLYQASAEGDLQQTAISMKSDMVDGVEVSIWQEQGLLLGLASSQ